MGPEPGATARISMTAPNSVSSGTSRALILTIRHCQSPSLRRWSERSLPARPMTRPMSVPAHGNLLAILIVRR